MMTKNTSNWRHRVIVTLYEENNANIADHFVEANEMVEVGSGANRSEIFQVDVTTISYHTNEISDSGELNKYSVVRKDWRTAPKNQRERITGTGF